MQYKKNTNKNKYIKKGCIATYKNKKIKINEYN